MRYYCQQCNWEGKELHQILIFCPVPACRGKLIEIRGHEDLFPRQQQQQLQSQSQYNFPIDINNVIKSRMKSSIPYIVPSSNFKNYNQPYSYNHCQSALVPFDCDRNSSVQIYVPPFIQENLLNFTSTAPLTDDERMFRIYQWVYEQSKYCYTYSHPNPNDTKILDYSKSGSSSSGFIDEEYEKCTSISEIARSLIAAQRTSTAAAKATSTSRSRGKNQNQNQGQVQIQHKNPCFDHQQNEGSFRLNPHSQSQSQSQSQWNGQNQNSNFETQNLILSFPTAVALNSGNAGHQTENLVVPPILSEVFNNLIHNHLNFNPNSNSVSITNDNEVYQQQQQQYLQEADFPQNRHQILPHPSYFNSSLAYSNGATHGYTSRNAFPVEQYTGQASNSGSVNQPNQGSYHLNYSSPVQTRTRNHLENFGHLASIKETNESQCSLQNKLMCDCQNCVRVDNFNNDVNVVGFQQRSFNNNRSSNPNNLVVKNCSKKNGKRLVKIVIQDTFDKARNSGSIRPPFPQGLLWKLYSHKILGDLIPSEMCELCKHDFEFDKNALRLHCYHVFHEVCIFGYLKLSGTCPKCNLDVAEAIRCEENREREKIINGAGAGYSGDTRWN